MEEQEAIKMRAIRVVHTPEIAFSQEHEEAAVREEDVSASLLTVGVLILSGLAIVGALYFGKEVLLPIALAVVLKLTLRPIMGFLCDKLGMPAAVSAMLLMVCLFGVVAAVALTISAPASLGRAQTWPRRPRMAS